MSENQANQSAENSDANPPTDLSVIHDSSHPIPRARIYSKQRDTGKWALGIVLILLGAVFMLQNIGVLILHNWWALFIMIPAITSFSTAYSQYRRNGNRLSYAVRGSLIGGCGFSLLTAAFLFDISFGIIWPLALIAGGIVLLINFAMPE